MRFFNTQSLVRAFPVIIAVAWFAAFSPALTKPWIDGVDPIFRLLASDRILVSTNHNVWLPVLQIAIQLVRLISDTPFAYKLMMLLISAGALALLASSLQTLFGTYISFLTCSFFFIDGGWVRAATSLYLEPFAVLFLSAALFFSIRGRRGLSSSLTILASFSRPEVLLAAPLVVAGCAFVTGDLRRSAKLGLLFVPAAGFYLLLLASGSDFRLGHQFDISMTQKLLENLLAQLTTPLSRLAVALAAFSELLLRMVSKRKETSVLDRTVTVLALLAIAFALEYVLLAPFLHPGLQILRPRHTIAFALILYFLAGSFLSRFHGKENRLFTPLAVVLLLWFMASKVSFFAHPPPALYYRVSTRVQRALNNSGCDLSRKEVEVCAASPMAKTTLLTVIRHGIEIDLRFSGWKVNPVACLPVSGHLHEAQEAPLSTLPRIRVQWEGRPVSSPEQLVFSGKLAKIFRPVEAYISLPCARQ